MDRRTDELGGDPFVPVLSEFFMEVIQLNFEASTLRSLIVVMPFAAIICAPAYIAPPAVCG